MPYMFYTIKRDFTGCVNCALTMISDNGHLKGIYAGIHTLPSGLLYQQLVGIR